MEEFDAEIYDIVRQIPPGRVVTYGQEGLRPDGRPSGSCWSTRA